MMRLLRTIATLLSVAGAFAALACSTVREEDDDDGGGGQVSCEQLEVEAARSTPITVTNRTNGPIFLLNDCGFGVPDRMSLDGKPMFGSADTVSCQDFLEGICAPPPTDCARSDRFEIAAGASTVFAWDGRTRRAAFSPPSCFPEDETCAQGPPRECIQLAVVPDGAHELSIPYARGDRSATPEQASITATFPTPGVAISID